MYLYDGVKLSELCERTHKGMVRSLGKDAALSCSALVVLAIAHGLLGNLEKQLELVNFIEEKSKIFPHDEARMMVLLLLAGVMVERPERELHQRADVLSRRAFAIYAAHPTSQDAEMESFFLANWGAVQARLGRMELACELMEETISKVDKNTGYQVDLSCFESKLSLAMVYCDLKQEQKAAPLIEEVKTFISTHEEMDLWDVLQLKKGIKEWENKTLSFSKCHFRFCHESLLEARIIRDKPKLDEIDDGVFKIFKAGKTDKPDNDDLDGTGFLN